MLSRVPFTGNPAFKINMSCDHCAEPACLPACPTGAIFKRKDNGVVDIDSTLCIGCRKYEAACPFGAMSGAEDAAGFVDGHVLNWMPEFLEKAARPAECALYRAILQMTDAVLDELRDELEAITGRARRVAFPSPDDAQQAGTAALLNSQAEQSDAKIDIEEEPRVLAHDSDIRMLVLNLMLNAIHAMPDGGTVRVSCHADGAGRIRLQVADSGVGFPEDLRDKVMLPFWTRRADGSRGRGLGLTICNAIVGALGRQIGFESEVGRGTVFTADLADADKREE